MSLSQAVKSTEMWARSVKVDIFRCCCVVVIIISVKIEPEGGPQKCGMV